MRDWHRWIMTAFGIVLAYWVAAGLTTALYDTTDRTQVWAMQGGGPGQRLTDFAVSAPAIPDPAALAPGIAAAARAAGPMPIAAVDLRMQGAAPRLQFSTADGALDAQRRFDARTGAPLADADQGAPPPNVVLRNTIKSFHKGDAGGIPGQLVGLFAGLALIGLTVTGLVTYARVWNARRRMGRGAILWNSRDSLWRRMHRWTAILASALVLNIALSGTILAVAEIQLNLFLQYHVGVPPYPRPDPAPPISASVLPSDWPAMLETSYRTARASRPDAPVAALTLVERPDGIARGLATYGGPRPRIVAFDARTGARATDWTTGGVLVGHGYFTDWHQVVKRIHRGDIVGHFWGRYIDIAAGLALLYLVVSSFVMYAEMWRKRADKGRRALFWR